MTSENPIDYSEIMAYIEWLEAQQPAKAVVAQALEERSALREWLSAHGATMACSGTKPHSGDLSPGCVKCTTGHWSCVFLNYACTASCMFCPKEHTAETTISASYLEFPSVETFLDFAEQTGVSGISISGGEPLLVLEKVLFWYRQIRNRFGPDHYLWMYSNGDLVNHPNLKMLKEAGLNEIRINISAREYDLTPVASACDVLDTVSIEIPAIPEDFELLKEILPELVHLGVSHLNLHELFATQANYRALAGRPYTYLDPSLKAFVWESERAALGLMKYGLENGISLPIHFCASDYKNTFQHAHKRLTAARFLQGEHQQITERGYLRQISVESGLKNQMKRIDPGRRKWGFDSECGELILDPELLEQPGIEGRIVTLRYYNSELTNLESPPDLSEKGLLIHISPEYSVEGIRCLAAEFKDLPADKVKGFLSGRKEIKEEAWMKEALEYETL